MNKKELWKNLSAGKKLMDVLPVVDGQDCLIVSVTDKEYEDSKDDDIVYIPDFDLNEILFDKDLSNRAMERMHILDYCYTKRSFIDICKNSRKMAYDLFTICDWQNPNLDDLLCCIDDSEMVEKYGMTNEEFDNLQYE